MTLPSRILSEPEIVEDESVADSLSLTKRLRKIGGQRLLLARLDWERLFKSAEPPGAVAPSVARATLTKDSKRRWAQAQKERRQSRFQKLVDATNTFHALKAMRAR